jgi:hypothetical protein
MVNGSTERSERGEYQGFLNPTKCVPPLATHVLDPDRPINVCHWFAGCSNASDKQVDHPTLGWVPICDGHLKWLKEG